MSTKLHHGDGPYGPTFDWSGRLTSVKAKPRPGWWASSPCRRQGRRTPYAHLPRFIHVYIAGLSAFAWQDRTRYAITYWCGGSTPDGVWMADHGSLTPCLRCVGSREHAHLFGQPCAFPCELGCAGAA